MRLALCGRVSIARPRFAVSQQVDVLCYFPRRKHGAKQQHVQIVGLPRSSFSRYNDATVGDDKSQTELKRHISFVTFRILGLR